MKKQKVFIPTKDDEGFTHIISDEHGNKLSGAKQVEGYFFTEDQFDFFLLKCRVHARRAASIKEYIESLNLK